jgi:predicted DNA-binding protein (MmcQ/YjbR family)
MNIEELREYCLSLKGITEETPFGPDNLVYKVMGKMYALIPIDSELPCVVLKNTPDKNEYLRNEYDYVTVAYHFNKVHWISINNTQKNSELSKELIRESYELVKAGLTKKLKTELENLD